LQQKLGGKFTTPFIPKAFSDFITENHFSEKQLCGHTSIDLELVFAT